MASWLDQGTEVAPSADTPETQGTSWLEQGYQKANPQAGLPLSAGDNKGMRYSTAPLTGAAKGGASILDTFSNNTGASPQATLYASPNESEEYNQARDSSAVPKTDFTGYAEKHLPEPKDQIEAGLQGVGKGTVENAPFGPAAMIPGALSEGVSSWADAAHPDNTKANSILGFLAGLTPTKTLMRGIGYAGEKLGLSKTPDIVQARDALGITGNTAAGLGEENSFPRGVRAARESPFDYSIERQERLGRSQISDQFDNAVDDLNPPRGPNNLPTDQSVGEPFQKAAKTWQENTSNDLKNRTTALDNAVDPETTKLPVKKLFDDLDAAFTAPKDAPQMDAKAVALKDDMKQKINDVAMLEKYGPAWQDYARMGYTADGDSISLAAVKYLKKRVNEDYETGILSNQQADVRNNKLLGQGLADTEKLAYQGTPLEGTFNDLQNDWHNYFNNLENHIQPYLEGEGKTPEKALASLLSEKRVGDTKISDTLNLLPPEIKNSIAANEFNKMGRGADGNFNPDQFFKNWTNPKRGLSPEAKEALFSGPNGEIPKLYDQIATVSQEQARSEAARNTSGTAGTKYLLHILGTGAKAGAAGAGVGAAYSYQNGDMGGNLGWGGGIGGTIGAAGDAAFALMAPKLLTNPAFLRLMVTNPAIDKLPLKLRALASANPQIANEATALANKTEQDQSKTQEYPVPSGFSPTPNYTSPPAMQNKAPEGFSQEKNFKAPPNVPDHFDNEGAVVNPTPQQRPGFMSGGVVSAGFPNQEVSGFAKGGPLPNDNLNGKIDRLRELELENQEPVAPPSGDFYQRLLPKDPVKDDPKGMAAGGEVNADDPVSLSISSKPSYAEGDRIPPTQQWLDSRSGYGQEVENNTGIPHREDQLNSAVWGHRDTEENNYPRDEQSILGRFMLPPPRHEKFDFAKELENADRDYNLANPPSWHNWGGMAAGGLADSPFLDSEWSANLNRPYTANDSTELRPSMPAYSLDPRVSILDNILPMRANDNSYAEGGEVTNKEPPKFADGTLGDIQRAVFHIESGSGSNYNVAPVKGHSASGPMQIIPTTFAGNALPGEQLTNFQDNMRVGFRLLEKLYNQYHGDVAKTLYSYANGSPSAPDRNPGYLAAAAAFFKRGNKNIDIPLDHTPGAHSKTPAMTSSSTASNETPTPFDDSDTQPNTDENQEATLNNNDDDERTTNFDNVIQNQDWVEPTTKLAAHEILKG